MEGPCETIKSGAKWQNLKFAEISAWRRVSDHFKAVDLFDSVRCEHPFGFCSLHGNRLKPMRNESIALVIVDKCHHTPGYRHH